uniref:Uncharacterized protein n=1 Tax=uncultured Elusimicrobia bacterium TaxID=699876 RepID=A0A650EMV3_9BACT|nr:hypothetical protein Elusimicrob1349_1110 [uncultured Elusimicrobia bacterium]
MNIVKTQYSFAGGEVSAGLYGRSDLEKHDSAFARGQNALVDTRGALLKRPGMLHVETCKLTDKRVYFAKFVFSVKERFTLEFGDKYIRFLRPEGYVTANGQPYEVPSPYQIEDLARLQYVQSADVLFLGVPGYAPKMLTRYADDDWRLENYTNKNGPFEIDAGDRAALSREDDGTLLLTHLSGLQFTPEDVGSYFKLERDFEAASFNFEQSSAATAATLLENVFPCCGSWQLNSSGSWTGTVKLEYSEDGHSWKNYRSYSSVYKEAGTGANINASGEISGQIKLLRLNCTGWSSGTCYLTFRTNLFTYNIFGVVRAYKNAQSAVVQLTNLPDALQASVAGNVAYEAYTAPAMTANHAPEGEAFFDSPGFTGTVVNEDGSACEESQNAYKAFDGTAESFARVPVYKYADGPKLGRLFGARKLVSSVSVAGGLAQEDTLVSVYVYNASTGWKLAAEASAPKDASLAVTLNFPAVAADGVGISLRAQEEDNSRENGNDGFPIETLGRDAGGDGAKAGAMTAFAAEVSAINAGASSIVYAGVEMKYFAPAWGGKKGWPHVVTMHQGRLIWPGEGKVWTSKIDDFNNFEVSLTVTDDDAISANVKDGGLNNAVAAVSMQKLVLLTDGGEFVSSADVLTPKASGFLKQSNYGAAPLRPVIIGNRVLFVQLLGGRIRDLQYDYSTDNWQADDLCALAPHLFEGKQIVAWDYQPAPQGVLWVVLDDGTLLALAYERVHNLLAWTHIQTAGNVEDVCVIPGERESVVMLAVNRFGTRRIEKFAPRVQGANVSAQVYLDAAKQFTFDAPQSELDGLEHLEGQAVRVLADGEDWGHFTVTGGALNLPQAAKTVLVGLDYAFDFVSLPAALQGQSGEWTGKLRLTRLLAGLENSKGGQCGAAGGPLDPMNYSQDGELFTGEMEQTVESASARGLQVRVTQSGPWPFKITKLIMELKG